MRYLFSLILLSIFWSSCFNQCPLFGSTSYSSELRPKQALPYVTLDVNESYIFVPNDYYYIEYNFSGTEGCGLEDYYTSQGHFSKFSTSFSKDSIATFKYFNYDSILVNGINPGETVLKVIVTWEEETTADIIWKSDTLKLFVNIEG
jgi:hypothetical protein